LGFFDAGDVADFELGVAIDLTAELLRYFTEFHFLPRGLFMANVHQRGWRA
jgi:hypothetical protein